MASWRIQGCTVADGPALARNNMSAFWEDPTWILLWPKDITLDYLVEQAAKRQPRNLLRGRDHTRHEKAVDPATGALVGYARWLLPPARAASEDGSPLWAAAQVPDVTDEERSRFDQLAEAAWWSGQSGMSRIDDKNEVVMDRILAERDYIKLDYLAVHPDNKGRGIATALVESGILRAKEIGIPIFTMAYKAGLGVYMRFGFREVERVIQDDSEFGGLGEYGAYFLIYDVEA